MNDFPLILMLAIGTMAVAMGVAFWSKKATEERLDDPDAPKSSLAKDGPGPQPLR